MLNQMSAGNIKTTIDKLVSFGTRQTLSSTTDPNRGIGAARDYIFHTLQGYAAASGGRMTVAEQPFIQPKSKDPDARNPRNTQITNVVATLKGTQPASTNRVYVVSGHYDSRCTARSTSSATRPARTTTAPGVAAMMEMARVMSQHSFDATIKFITVAGRGGGPLRLGALRQGGQAAAHGHRGHAQQRHHRLGHRAQRAEDAVHGPAVLRGDPHRPHAGTTRPICRTSAARATRRRASWLATCRRWPRTTPPT